MIRVSGGVEISLNARSGTVSFFWATSTRTVILAYFTIDQKEGPKLMAKNI